MTTRIWFNRPKFDEGQVPPRGPFLVQSDGDVRPAECFGIVIKGPSRFVFDKDVLSSPHAWLETDAEVELS